MYTLKGRVRYSETDAQGKLTIPALMNYLQDCCTFQSEDVGIGLAYLMEQNRAWFVNSWQIKIQKLPRMGDEILVHTWPYDFKGFYGFRNFTLVSPQGEVFAQVNSVWIFMDTATGRPARMEPEVGEAYGKGPVLEGEWASRKIKTLGAMTAVSSFQVEKFHLDTNQHMNNEKYVEAARECLPENSVIKELRTEYRKAAVLGDTIYMKKVTEGDITQVALCDATEDIYAIVEFKRAK